MTLPVGLYSLVGQFVIKWTDIATGSIIAVLPPSFCSPISSATWYRGWPRGR